MDRGIVAFPKIFGELRKDLPYSVPLLFAFGYVFLIGWKKEKVVKVIQALYQPTCEDECERSGSFTSFSSRVSNIVLMWLLECKGVFSLR